MSDVQQQESGGGGFTVRRRFPASAERVYAAFVEPDKLEHWFVVRGYRTPADRMQVSAEPGGRVDAVMISESDGSEIPFGFEYGVLEPPHRLQLRFKDPRELVTVALSDAPEGEVDLTYHLISWPAPQNEESSRQGVEGMLDLIEDGIRRGVI
jgi:uncharacterized protein YndB with AHSA1/START domain